MSHTANILLKILNWRLRSKMEEQLEEELFGFRKGKGTRDAIGLTLTIGESVSKFPLQALRTCSGDQDD